MIESNYSNWYIWFITIKIIQKTSGLFISIFLNKVIGFQSQNLQKILYEKGLQVINFKKFKFRVFIIPIKKVKKINFFFFWDSE